MVNLPLTAAKLQFTRPKLFFLGLFPGLFTFALSSAAVYLLWLWLLQGMTLWLSVPFMMMGFLLSWLLLGNLSLIPVEDAIIDECQKAVWGEVKLAAPPMGVKRLLREAGYSGFLAFVALFFFLVSFIPILGLVSFFLAAWMTAYGFLASLYARKSERLSSRLQLFFRDGITNFLLGAFIGILLFVPVLNVFLLGYAQILASLLFLRREARSLPGPREMA